MNEQLKAITLKELERNKWKVKRYKTKVKFTKDNTKEKIEYNIKNDDFIFNIEKVDYDVINYIVVYCYYVSAEKEKIIN